MMESVAVLLKKFASSISFLIVMVLAAEEDHQHLRQLKQEH